jgi:(p)ppGpp synthase/HD superfamily hydrolase
MLTQYSKDMERVIQALNLCRNLHEGQTDKCGQPYWIHPFTVAFRGFSGYNHSIIPNIIVGLLHDIPEDTGMSVDALATLIELTDEEKSALDLLTRKDGVSYNEYVNSIVESGNKIAIDVKLDDLLHNMDLNRFTDAGLKVMLADEQRHAKYHKTFEKLYAKLNED